MTTTLINTRKTIMPQIHASWNQFRSTDKAMVFMFGEVGSNYNDYHDIPLAKDYTEKDAPWSTKQSVLERNMVHANKLIRLYIALNIDIEHRMHIWEFFEIGTGVVSKIKEHTKLLKRIQKVLKLEQELEVHELIPSATCLFRNTGHLSLANIEDFFKLKVKEAKAEAKADAIAHAKEVKAAKRRNAALRRAKKEQKRKDAAKKKKIAKKKKKALKRTEDWIEATKQGKNVTKRDILKMLKMADKEGHTIADVIAELESQLQ
tara:strand:- start:447 stop:1232 length:786 start_codon:yes stop_codon:yes gene_type:complete